MKDIKFCQGCGRIVSRIDDADWYSHMSIKYCSDCRAKSDREKTAERMKRFRARNKQIRKLKDEKLALLEDENELLRKNLIRLREEMDRYRA